LVDLTITYKIFVFTLLLAFFGHIASAEEIDQIVVEEIGSNYVKGTYNGEGTIHVYQGEILLGKGEAVLNRYKIMFIKPLQGGTQLTLKIDDTELSKVVEYRPAVLKNVDDKAKRISGIAVPGAAVTAMVNSQAIPLKSLNETNGNFEFQSSSQLKYGAVVEVISMIGNIKSVVSTTVIAGPAPAKPKVNPLSNKNTYISGNAEPGAKVNILIGKASYMVTASANGSFRLNLPHKRALPAGTVVNLFVTTDRKNSKSGTVTLKVLDKIPPAAPRVNKLTNKSFSVSGSAEANSTLYVLRNSKKFKTVKVNSKGKFSIKIPLLAANSKLEFYSRDSAGNTGAKTKLIVTNQKRPSKKVISAPLIRQMPELPRGCEVTSLAMMLNHAGVKSNKMTLARQVKKDPTLYKYSKGKKYFGNPNYGFVGNMYTFSKPGFGVFNKPIAELANTYMPGRIVNLSGQSFDSVLNYVAAGRPVWVINTSWFSYVPSKYWQTWYTPQGPVRITMKEHSVLVTGYDSKYVYFNDPLDGQKNKKRLKKYFIEGWTQYGKQAISYY
jgi:uncharacterized protein YvpB